MCANTIDEVAWGTQNGKPWFGTSTRSIVAVFKSTLWKLNPAGIITCQNQVVEDLYFYVAC